jgi:hypothetical protein
MIEVEPRTRGALWGLVGAVLAAGWATYGITGGSTTSLAIMVAATIILGAVATFLVRVRQPS